MTLPRRAALLAGVGYVVIIAAGIFAEFFVRARLLVPGDPAATFANLAASPDLLRVGIAAEVVMLLADAGVAVALWVLFANADRTMSAAAAVFRLLHSAVAAANLSNLLMPMTLAGGVGAAALPAPGADVLVGSWLELHRYGYNVGLIFFAVHLALVGWLMLRRAAGPRVIGALLGVAALAYLVDGFGSILSAGWTATPGALIAAMVAGEMTFCGWLIVTGLRRESAAA